MPFGFFSSEYSDQGTADDGKETSLTRDGVYLFIFLKTIGNWEFFGLNKTQRFYAFGIS
jgi:hypothetical protein